MTLNLMAAVAIISLYLFLRLTIPWFYGRESEQHDRIMKIAGIILKITAYAFACWGLFILYAASKETDRLSSVFVAGYGLMQFGLAVFLYRLPILCERDSWSGPWSIGE